jgi:hypothetical protein
MKTLNKNPKKVLMSSKRHSLMRIIKSGGMLGMRRRSLKMDSMILRRHRSLLIKSGMHSKIKKKAKKASLMNLKRQRKNKRN